MATNLLVTERERRLDLATRIKSLGDVDFPRLQYWNYDPCPHHTTPQVTCKYRACGGELFSHQRVGAAWLYAVKKGLLADDPGVGKTNQILALIALLKENGELNRRALIIPNTPAISQWKEEAARWTPNVRTLMVDSTLTKRQRIEKYATPWDALIIGSALLISDADELSRIGPFDLVVSDDVDPLLSHANKTHRAITRVSRNATRAFTVNATTLQVRLQQLHAAFEPTDDEAFGPLSHFERRHIRQTGDTRRIAYKNINELKDKLRPIYLRRKATELTDIRMPMLMPPQIEWLEMSQTQRLRYTELQQGVLRMMREEGTSVKRVNALAKFTYGGQICAGLQALGEPDLPGSSPKLDRLFQRLDTVWADRKTLVFVKNIGMVRAAIQRTDQRDYTCAVLWGQGMSAQQKTEQKEKFWDDPDCRFLIGTVTLERSHNLQCSNNVVALDTQLNPARVWQLVGRSKRAGSPFDRVFLTQYLMQDSQESNYLRICAERQAMADAVFEEEGGELFEQLSPLELLQIMMP